MFINYLYLASAVAGVTSSNVLCGFYSRRTANKKDASALFSFVELCAIFLFWLIMFIIDGSFHAPVLIYSLAFALFFTMGKVGHIFAVRSGSVVITSLIIQSSLILVSVWGMLFWNADFTLRVGIGLVLVAVSLFLCIYKGKEVDGEKKKVSLRWIIFCLIAFVGNAGCTITQKTQQLDFNGKYGNMLMTFATAISVLVTLFIYLKSDRRDSKVILKSNFYFPVLSGASNVVLNLFVMLLAVSALSPTLIYPTIAVGGLILTALISLVVFKEKLRVSQWIGVIIGIIATAILS